MPNGYAGRILHVDLTNQKIWVENPPESFYRQYFGGSAVGMYYLLKEVKPGIDALGPDNVLALTIGVPTGAPVSGNSRLTATAKSPLTGGAGDAQAGGFFPAEMKFAGFDAVIVRGKAKHPVYLWLHDGQAELPRRLASVGKTTAQTEDILKQELGDSKIEVAQIGPAGEKMARLACIINYANRANGRTGMGAVMGSKNLKAVVVRGSSKKIPLGDAKRLNEPGQVGGPAGPGQRQHARSAARRHRRRCSQYSTQRHPSHPELERGSVRGFRADLRRDDDRDHPQAARHLLRLRHPLQAGGGDLLQRPPGRAQARRPGIRDASAPSALTAGSTTWAPCATRTRCATSMAWIPWAPAPPSPGRWSATATA